jgi:hypothetical protein
MTSGLVAKMNRIFEAEWRRVECCLVMRDAATEYATA